MKWLTPQHNLPPLLSSRSRGAAAAASASQAFSRATISPSLSPPGERFSGGGASKQEVESEQAA